MAAPRALLLPLLSASLLFACKKEDPKPAESPAPAAAAEAAPDAKAEGEAPAKSAATRPRVTSSGPLQLPPRVSEDASVVMQFVMADADALLEKMGEIQALAQYKQYLDAKGLQALAAMGNEEYAEAIRGFDVTAPVGCAALAKEPYEKNFGCAFTFKGGAAALVSSLGPRAKADIDGHAGLIEAEGQKLYVDALDGDHVAVSAGAESFGALKGHLAKDVLARAGQLGARAEFVAMGKEAMALMVKANELNPKIDEPAVIGEPFTDGMKRIIYRVQQWQHDNPAAGLDGLQQYTFAMDVVGGLPNVDFAMHVDPASDMGKAYKAAAYRQLDPGELKTVPPGTLGFILAGMNSAQWGEEAFENGQSQAMTRIWGEETGLGAEAVKTGLEGYFKSWAGKYAPMLGMTIDAREDGRVGLTMVRKLGGESLRDDYATWMGGLKPADLFGKKMGAALEFEFTRAAVKVGEHEVDRLIVKPAGVLAKQIADDADPFAKTIADGIVIDYVEVGGYALTMFDLDPRTRSQQNWVEWLAKPVKDRTGAHMGSFARPPAGLGFVGGVDISAIAKLSDSDFSVLHGGLDDIRLYGASIAPSNFMGRFEVSAAFLDAVSKAAAAEGGPGM